MSFSLGLPWVSNGRTTVSGLISKVIPFSCVDGPGNRFVIFLQGCNFNCKNCHNPQTINFCNHCGDCVEQCPSEALSLNDGKISWNSRQCESCDQCLDICPVNSSPMVEEKTVEELLQQIRVASPFIDGITLSGGEATVQLKFVKAFFTAVKNDSALNHLTCLIDSNGYLPLSAWKSVLPVMDGAMIDLKAMDADLHKWLTGRDNFRVFQTIEYLASVSKLIEVRLLIIPNINDTAEEKMAVKDYLSSLNTNINIKVNAFSNKAVKGEAIDWLSLSEEKKALYLQSINR
ncbi:YjjW family glycine radical enzyme activase [Endozoicomonas gorgoniicola]|uniref:YjjW family glycine radical enzyme activase n=1 Tax=Endozoicomonas gorgoniicola TaxID=1234144 RepID=A0ABT3MX28_9GAMM|nr:YjjW family glycine radical enzyme activase [Endozoicomonas gorgoniicola]MCW7553921.1 YjjW family glycine radical enzyme activase [Endozoicomonas gorgoniicola]